MKIKNKYIFLCVGTLFLLAIDIITKIVTTDINITVWENVISFVYVENTGAAFSIFNDSTFLLAIFSAVFLLGFIIYDIFTKRKHKIYIVSLTLILAGGIGNMIDRFFLGYVRDFIKLDFFPQFAIFNFADICLTVGVVLLVIFFLFLDKEEMTK